MAKNSRLFVLGMLTQSENRKQTLPHLRTIIISDDAIGDPPLNTQN